MRALHTYLTVPEYAKKKGLSTTSVYRAIDDGRIIPTYVGVSRMAFIPPAALKIEFRVTTRKEVAQS